MREFSYNIENFGKGIRYDYRQLKGQGYLEQLNNAEPFDNKIVTWQPSTNPFDISQIAQWQIDINYPYPQLFKGKTYWLLADASRIFIVDKYSFNISHLDVYDYANPDTLGTIQESGLPWQFVDFGDTWMLFNGLSTVFHHSLYKIQGQTDYAFVQSDVYIEAGCSFRGRALLGGFASGALWSNDWKAYWDNQANLSAYGLNANLSVEDNQVWFSTIGGGDLFWLFYPSFYLRGINNSYTEDQSYTALYAPHSRRCSPPPQVKCCCVSYHY